MEFNGVVLMSSILDFAVATPGIDHVYIVNLPTEAAIAWYHNKVPNKPADIATFLADVRRFRRDRLHAGAGQGRHHRPGRKPTAIANQMSRISVCRRLHQGSKPARQPAALPQGAAARRTPHGRPSGRPFPGHRSGCRGRDARWRHCQRCHHWRVLAVFNQYAATELKFTEERPYLPNNYGAIGRNWDWKRKKNGGWLQAPTWATTWRCDAS